MSTDNAAVTKLLQEKKDKIAHIIQSARVQKGLTQRELGDRVDMSQNTIARIENAKFFPEMKSFLLILEALDLTLKIEDEKI
jgi:transcriptional regulator with XRE-family HTH domain